MVSQWYDPERGSAAVPGAIARALLELGHDVEVVTGYPNYPDGSIYPGFRQHAYQRQVRDGVVVHRVPLRPDHSKSGSARALCYSSFAATASVLGVPHVRKPDVWLAYSTPATVAAPAMLAGAVGRRPVVTYIQDLWPDTVLDSGFVRSPRISRLVEQTLHRFCDTTYRVSEHLAVSAPGMARRLIERGVHRDKISVVPNWVDEGMFRPAFYDGGLADRLGLKDQFVVMYAGSIGELQGLDVLLDAAGLLLDLGDLVLALVGSGVDEERLRRTAEQRGLRNVRFLGHQPPQHMARILRLGHVQLISLRDLSLLEVTVPSKVQTTLACGRPVVAAVPGDAAELIRRSGAGPVVRPGDATALAEQVRRLHGMPVDEREALGARGHLYYQAELSRRVGAARLSDALEAAVLRSKRVGVH